jgi:hypothetical protein
MPDAAADALDGREGLSLRQRRLLDVDFRVARA